MKPARRRLTRAGYSLLEMTIAMSLLSVVMGAVTTVLRTGGQAFEASEADQGRTRTAHSAVRHIVRAVREASDVVSVTNGQTANSQLEVKLDDGSHLVWQHNATTKQILFTDSSVSSTPSLLATDIDGLIFTAVRVDQSSYDASKTDRIQALNIEVDYSLPRETTVTRRAIGSVWLRPFGRNRLE